MSRMERIPAAELWALRKLHRVAAYNARLIESTNDNGGQVCAAEFDLVEAVAAVDAVSTAHYCACGHIHTADQDGASFPCEFCECPKQRRRTMVLRVQKKAHGESKWTDVGTSQSLDDAIALAVQTEKHAPPDQSREFDVQARVLLGRKVVWK